MGADIRGYWRVREDPRTSACIREYQRASAPSANGASTLSSSHAKHGQEEVSIALAGERLAAEISGARVGASVDDVAEVAGQKESPISAHRDVLRPACSCKGAAAQVAARGVVLGDEAIVVVQAGQRLAAEVDLQGRLCRQPTRLQARFRPVFPRARLGRVPALRAPVARRLAAADRSRPSALSGRLSTRRRLLCALQTQRAPHHRLPSVVGLARPDDGRCRCARSLEPRPRPKRLFRAHRKRDRTRQPHPTGAVTDGLLACCVVERAGVSVLDDSAAGSPPHRTGEIPVARRAIAELPTVVVAPAANFAGTQ